MINLALIIAILLAIGMLFIHLQIRRNPSTERLKNRKRLIAWCMIFAVCLLCFSFGLVGITMLSLGLITWAGIELSQMLGLKLTAMFSLIAGVAVTALLAGVFLWPETSRSLFYICLLTAGLAYLLPINSVVFRPLFYTFCVMALTSIILVAVLASQAGINEGYLLLVLFFVTAVNDIAQYIAGHLLGKTAIAGKLSPSKTLEGVLGGMLISAVLCAYLLPTVLTIDYAKAASIGGLLGLAGFLGDLNLSKIKRALNIKDSGNSIMGHGGLFDRIDSLLLIIPVFGVLVLLGGHL